MHRPVVDGATTTIDDGVMGDRAADLLDQILRAVPLPGPRTEVLLPSGGTLPSAFAVSDLAQASIGAAGAALARVAAGPDGDAGPVTVDRDLASAWFALSLRPDGWQLPPVWDSVAGDYATADGWIKLHTNAPHHRAAALGVLGVPGDRDAVTAEVARWDADDLEAAVVGAGGAAAAKRSGAAWDAHPQGAAVGAEPLLRVERTTPGPGWPGRPPGAGPGRPLAGLRVLDLTRVLAGPVATRLLAGWGADVLRIDPPGWDEPNVVPEVTLGKRCAHLDLHEDRDRDRLLHLLADADIVVHGYRPGALDGLHLGADARDAARPGLIDVSLDAYGWTGPWAGRRGFDSLVQMSSGIAEAGQVAAGADHPVPLPVQALDHATGYLLAAAALTGVALRREDGRGSRWRASLARTSRLLVDAGVASALEGDGIDPAGPVPGAPVERTVWGDARRLPPPVVVAGAPLRWELPAGPLGTAAAEWPRR
jgi:crotonobetainyl-CoA:carnitine CoA-transferase CaiB-like acyl-CoA transferase